MSLVAHLRNIGLEDKEARVYLAMLELGPSTVLEIAAKAEVTRPTAYVIIETLKKKGLVSTQTRGKKQIFMGESPEQIKVNLDKEEKLIEQRKEELKQVMPDLESFFKSKGSKPEVRYFEGVDGLLKIQEEFLKCRSKQIFGISTMDETLKMFPKHKENYIDRRIQLGIKSRLIYTAEQPVLPERDESALRETKYISPQLFKFQSDITIFDNNVAISSLRGNVGGTIITSSDIAESFKALFELIWNTK